MSSSSKIEEVSQNCVVLDVVKFKKMKKSRRIVSFLTLIKKLTARQVDRQTDRQRERERDREIER